VDSRFARTDDLPVAMHVATLAGRLSRSSAVVELSAQSLVEIRGPAEWSLFE
jgi:hypothetical protein